MSGSEEKKFSWVYMIQCIGICIRFVTAVFVVWVVARPIAENMNSHIFKDLATFLPESPTEAHTAVNSLSSPNTSKIKSVGKNAKSQHTSHQEPVVTTANATIPRVWAYGIQASALVASLGVTLWAIVVLIRSD